MLAVWQGYKAEVVKRKGVQRLRVCLSCARAMRGRYKLESLPPNTPFACAMGEGQCGVACGVVWCGVAWHVWCCVLRRLRVCLCCALVYQLESLPPNMPFACAMGEGQCGTMWRGVACGVAWSGVACLVLCVEEAVGVPVLCPRLPTGVPAAQHALRLRHGGGSVWHGVACGVVWRGVAWHVWCVLRRLRVCLSCVRAMGEVSVAWRGVLCCDVVWHGMFGVICCVVMCGVACVVSCVML